MFAGAIRGKIGIGTPPKCPPFSGFGGIVCGPFPYISNSMNDSMWTVHRRVLDVCLKGSNLFNQSVFPSGEPGGGNLQTLSPGELGIRADGMGPLCVGGKSATFPLAVGFCLIEGDSDHGVLRRSV
jgi:hypothetical protein